MLEIKQQDNQVFEAIMKEFERQDHHIELIASENFVSKAVMEAQGSVLTNKYAEGYPHRRYYGGCEFVDIVEDLARDRIKELLERSMSTYNHIQVRRLIWPFIVSP